jgi:hypothetical protein
MHYWALSSEKGDRFILPNILLFCHWSCGSRRETSWKTAPGRWRTFRAAQNFPRLFVSEKTRGHEKAPV